MAKSQHGHRGGKDRELEAMAAIISLLEPLNEEERGRVLEYVLKRLEMAALRPTLGEPQQTAGSRPSTTQLVPDIRTLTAEKQPCSSGEMAALVAYYVSELAPEADRAATVNADILHKYFKMAQSSLYLAPSGMFSPTQQRRVTWKT